MNKQGEGRAGAPKVGLALGSGSSRGWAHIGVIRALAEAGVEISCIAGTSIGALVGAGFALDKMDVLEEFARQLDWKQIVSFLDVVFPRSGLFDGGKITEFFRGHVHEVNIQDLPLPYCAVATDLATGDEVVFSQGDLVEAIRASVSIPGVFTPARRDGAFLVDGGLVNPVPVSVARRMGADYVIAVDLNHGRIDKSGNGAMTDNDSSAKHGEEDLKRKITQELADRFSQLSSPSLSQIGKWISKEPTPNIIEVLTTSINIMAAQITEINLKRDPPDLLIRPRLGHLRLMEFHRAEEAIEEGYRETVRRLAQAHPPATGRAR
ncbi:patatin-like phospholipase family protein [Desulfoferula mesophila]|uniref:Patatin n=1 Tax=Desulfoferula mesophila TaxID=3058419 RepID=A0AAU9EWQ4_9BACT|nr:patatin [Desulfoferula mesophilus]